MTPFGQKDSEKPTTSGKRCQVIRPPDTPLAALFLALALVLSMNVFLAHPAFADDQDITIAELNNAGGHLDHQHVVFDAEVVGDIINGDDGNYWATLNDGTSSISVFIGPASRDSITSLGSYSQQGTILEVSGEFHLACDQHDGLSDVHAISTKVLDPGGPVDYQVNPLLLVAGGLLIAVGIGLSVLYNILRRRKI